MFLSDEVTRLQDQSLQLFQADLVGIAIRPGLKTEDGQEPLYKEIDEPHNRVEQLQKR